MPTAEPAGLRERKKARLRATITREALRLFTEHGFDSTTMEQIATASEVSVSTLFRYFPTKEDLVVTDEFGPRLAEAFESAPADLPVIAAFRSAFARVWASASASDVESKQQRELLVLSAPRLWAASLDSIRGAQSLLVDLTAGRLDRDPADPAVRAIGSAVFGVMLAVWLEWADDPDMDPGAVLDTRLSELSDSIG